jgi:hypothetical protein
VLEEVDAILSEGVSDVLRWRGVAR